MNLDVVKGFLQNQQPIGLPQFLDHVLPGIVRIGTADHNLDIRIHLPDLFDGLNTRRSLEIAQIQSKVSKIETEEIIHTLSNSLIQLLELYNIQKDLIQVADENLAATKLNLEISEEKFRNGAINSFNFRDVQIIYLNASLQRLASIYNIINTETQIARLTGSIINENQ